MKIIIITMLTFLLSINLLAAPKKGNILLTVFLKHNQEKNLSEIKAILKEQKFLEHFPPAGTSVVSWYVVMGIGQVVTLEVPGEKLSAVNLAVERYGWKAYKSEYYPTYDLYPIVKKELSNKSKIEL